jgi:hypothetical protein
VIAGARAARKQPRFPLPQRLRPLSRRHAQGCGAELALDTSLPAVWTWYLTNEPNERHRDSIDDGLRTGQIKVVLLLQVEGPS